MSSLSAPGLPPRRGTGFLSAFRIGIHSAFIEMATNRFRSFLTLLGVALCVGAVTAMLSLLRGMNTFMENTVNQMGGANRLALQTEDPSGFAAELRASRSRGLRLADADSLEKHPDSLYRPLRRVQDFMDLRFLSRTENAPVIGLDAASLAEEKVFAEEGRLLWPEEFARGERSCVVGWGVAERLRETLRAAKDPDSALVGRFLTLGEQRYRIVGVYGRTNRRMTWFGRFTYIPMEAMRRDFKGRNPEMGMLQFEMREVDSLKAHADTLLSRTLRLHRGANNIGVQFFEWMGEFSSMMMNLQVLFGVVGFIALTTGGVNILNVMLSTLYARINEIGIRKSLGATSFQIFLQFLVESVTLSISGGLIGALLGSSLLLFADTVEEATRGVRPQLGASGILLIFALAVLLGILSGLYPAFRASRLKPVEALRYD